MSSFKYQVSGCRKQCPYVVLPYTCRNLSHSISDKIKDRKKNSANYRKSEADGDKQWNYM